MREFLKEFLALKEEIQNTSELFDEFLEIVNDYEIANLSNSRGNNRESELTMSRETAQLRSGYYEKLTQSIRCCIKRHQKLIRCVAQGKAWGYVLYSVVF